jgi:hypothetical protein
VFSPLLLLLPRALYFYHATATTVGLLSLLVALVLVVLAVVPLS